MRRWIGIPRWSSVLAGTALVVLLAGCGAGYSPQVVVLVGGGSSPPASAQSGATGGGSADATAGQTAFQDTCGACHGVDGKGLRGLGKNLAEPSDWFRQQDDAALLQFLKQGRPASDPLNTTKVDMPPKGGNPALTEADLESIVAYLRALQGQ